MAARQRLSIGKSPLEKRIEALTSSNGQRQDKPTHTIEQLLSLGGKPFLDRMREAGVDKRGAPIRVSGWYGEYLEFVGDLRIGEKYVTGCAQIGKSFAFYLLAQVINTEWMLDLIWAYDREINRTSQVKSHFKPIRGQWMKATGKQLLRADSQEVGLWQYRQLSSIGFVYVSTSTDRSDGLAGVGSALTGRTFDLAILDERSQAPLSCWEPIRNRLEQSRLPLLSLSNIGTPGSGAGIEADKSKAGHDFEPWCHCPSCGKATSLHPYDCLLKPQHEDESSPEFLSPTGRPIDWFHSDPSDPQASAYFGCSHCGAELTSEAREDAFFVCALTGITLRQYLDELPLGVPDRPQRIFINLYCSLQTKAGKAADLIRTGLESSFPANWIQQGLGMPSTIGAGCITLAMIRESYDRLLPEAAESLTVLGADQGRSDLWVWIMRVGLPKDWDQMPISIAIEQCTRTLLYAGGTSITELPILCHQHEVTAGMIDNEPDREAAHNHTMHLPIDLADQRPQTQTPKDPIERVYVKANKVQIPCLKLDTRLFLNQFYEGWALGHWSIPNWDHLSPSSERSPIRHLQALKRDPETLRWKRPDDHIDDLAFAGMFAEAALYNALSNRYQQWSIGSTQRSRTRLR